MASSYGDEKAFRKWDNSDEPSQGHGPPVRLRRPWPRLPSSCSLQPRTVGRSHGLSLMDFPHAVFISEPERRGSRPATDGTKSGPSVSGMGFWSWLSHQMAGHEDSITGDWGALIATGRT